MKPFMSFFCVLVLALATALAAQPSPASTVPAEVSSVAPSISAIASTGSRRVVIVERGFDPISHAVYLQWLCEPRSPDEEATVVATVSVAELSGGMWRVSDPKFIDSQTISMSAYFRFLDRPHDVTITFSETGYYTLRGDLTVREDEI